MEKKLINKVISEYEGYGAGSGDTGHYEYECLCRKGIVIEKHNNIPGFRDHDVYISCPECSEKYVIDISKGIRNWVLKEKNNNFEQ